MFAAHAVSSLTCYVDVLIQKWSVDDIFIAHAALVFILFPLICLMLFFWVYVFRPITVEHVEYRSAMMRPRFLEVKPEGGNGSRSRLRRQSQDIPVCSPNAFVLACRRGTSWFTS